MRKTFFKVVTVLCLCVFLSVAAVGCGGSGGESEEITSLTMWAGGQWTGDDLRNLQAFINDFNEKKPLGFKIELTPKADYEVSLTGAFAMGKQPDLFVWDRFNTPTYAKNKFLYPIDSLIERDGIDSSVYQQETYNELNYEGNQYGLPLDLGYWGVFVNNDLVDAYNATAADADKIVIPADKSWTWDDLYDAASKLTVRRGGSMVQAGYQTTAISEHIVTYYNSTGGQFLNEEMTEVAFADGGTYSKEFRDTLQFLHKLYRGDENGAFSQNGLNDKAAFVNGTLAMINQPNYFQSYIKSFAPDMNYTFLPQPKYSVNGETFAGSVNGGMLGGFGLAIPNPEANKGRFPEQPTKRIEAAWEFIKWWAYDAENSLEWTKTSASVPALKALYENEYLQNDEMLKTCADYAQYQRVRPQVSGWLFVQTGVLNTYIGNYVKGSLSLENAINEIAAGTKQTLYQYSK